VAIPFAEDSPPESGAAVASPTAEAPELPQETIEEELARLDQEWEWERKKYLVLGWTGDLVVPNRIAAAGAGTILVVAGFVVLLVSGGAYFSNRLIGLGLLAGGLGLGGYRVRQALAYEQAFRRYQGRRRIISSRQGA
jgi:hypothetical protein